MIDPAGLAAGELNDRCHDDKEKPDTGREQPEDRRALPKLVRRHAFHRKPISRVDQEGQRKRRMSISAMRNIELAPKALANGASSTITARAPQSEWLRGCACSPRPGTGRTRRRSTPSLAYGFFAASAASS